MNQRRHIRVAMLLTAAILLTGCRSNTAFRKQRYLESGKRFSAEGKYREASIQFLNALKVDQEFADAHYELAHAYEHLGQFVAATEELEHTIEAEPGNVAARLDLGNLFLANGVTALAQEQASTVLAAQPDNPDVHALLSAIASRQGHTDLSIAEIKRAIALNSKRAAFHQNLGILEANNPATIAEAEGEFKLAVALEPGSSNAKLLLASFYTRNNRLVEAEKAAWDAVVTDPKSVAARADVAQVILKQGDWARAEQVLHQASIDLADTPQGAEILADYYVSTQQFDKARAALALQISKSPKNTTLQRSAVRVLLQMHDYASAKTMIDSLLKTIPKDPEVKALNGILLLIDGNSSEGLIAIRDGVRFLPQDAFLQYWLGKATQARGEVNGAAVCFHRASELNPLFRAPLDELAKIASERSDDALLREVAEQAISVLPGAAEGYVWRAIVEMDHNSLADAEADLNSAIKVAPQSWQAYLQYGKLRFKQKKFSEGSAMLEQSLQYNPNSVQALRLLTDFDVFQKHPERAVARVNNQIHKSPKNTAFYNLLAQLQILDKKLDDAEATAERAIQINASDGEAVSLLAQIAMNRGKTAEAISAWLNWSSSHPDDAGALAVLGTLEESRGNLNDAVTYYKKALQIQPKQPIAANNLAYRMLQNGETPDIALTLAQTARQGMPDSATTADTLAWAYYRKGTYQFARDLLESAVNADPDCASMHFHLGMVYTKLNDKHSASLHLKKALSLPHDPQTTREATTALQGLG
jgi:tetratricopeptide (TPR) repeat protein